MTLVFFLWIASIDAFAESLKDEAGAFLWIATKILATCLAMTLPLVFARATPEAIHKVAKNYKNAES